MRIAQVAPLYESVPPKLYGGTERVVSYLTEMLVEQGHEVTLFASGDSQTAARLIAPCARSLRLDPDCKDPLACHLALLDEVFVHAREFDIIHFHTDYLAFPLCRLRPVPHLTTLHGRLDLPDLVPVYQRFAEEPLVSISDAQRKPLSWANWLATVSHGLPADLYHLHRRHDGYLAFVGRVSPEKGLDRAIEIARRCGLPLRIAAKVDTPDRAYFEQVIRPLLDTPGIEFVGEIGDAQKNDFLGHARALLFPIDWPEPFGLVMIEAMACGTPVIAWECGSVPEVVTHGVTGYVCRNLEESVAAVGQIDDIDRVGCRQMFELRFSSSRMARDYVTTYQRVLALSLRERVIANGRNHSGAGPVLHPGDIVAHR